MTLGFRVNAADLARFPKLRAMLRMGVGYVGINRKAAAEKQVMVLNVPDYATTEVTDHAMALSRAAHAALRRAAVIRRRCGRMCAILWCGGWVCRTFGFIGFGHIGTAVALRANAFGCRVVLFDPNLPNGTELGVKSAETTRPALLGPRRMRGCFTA